MGYKRFRRRGSVKSSSDLFACKKSSDKGVLLSPMMGQHRSNEEALWESRGIQVTWKKKESPVFSAYSISLAFHIQSTKMKKCVIAAVSHSAKPTITMIIPSCR